MARVLSALLGIKSEGSTDEVDSWFCGKTHVRILVAKCRRGNKSLLELSFVQKRSWWFHHSTTFYWSLSPELVTDYIADLENALQAMEREKIFSACGNWSDRLLSRLQGIQLIGDLGKLSLTDGNSTSFGFIGLKNGKRYFILKHTSGGDTSFEMFPQNALRNILEIVRETKQIANK